MAYLQIKTGQFIATTNIASAYFIKILLRNILSVILTSEKGILICLFIEKCNKILILHARET